MKENLENSFEKLTEQAMLIPEVKAYLGSFSVMIGDIVYARRLKMKFTRKELADVAKTTQRQITLIETAQGNISMAALNRVLRVMELEKISAEFSE